MGPITPDMVFPAYAEEFVDFFDIVYPDVRNDSNIGMLLDIGGCLGYVVEDQLVDHIDHFEEWLFSYAYSAVIDGYTSCPDPHDLVEIYEDAFRLDESDDE